MSERVLETDDGFRFRTVQEGSIRRTIYVSRHGGAELKLCHDASQCTSGATVDDFPIERFELMAQEFWLMVNRQ